ncbi:MBL fold metallo-hydrolase [Pseudarthrobacter phenanthrenivorans]|uniref:MBL fold metallo-hydrolase n=1 Tax=Pseudarthrobacter phenanthrenivorans TaxID=361575 RepID=UPI003F7F160C
MNNESDDQLILLGTAAGRTWYGGTPRAGIASAVVVSGSVYLVDCGSGAGRRLSEAHVGGAKGQAFSGLEALRSIFITHLHSDHTVGLAELLTFGLGEGLGRGAHPVTVTGPGPRGRIQPLASHAVHEPAVVNPADPTPGTHGMVNGLLAAFASDLNDNVRDSLRPSPATILQVKEIALPPEVLADPDTDVAPAMEPFEVYDDGNVRVLATLVQHAPVFPAFAYRLETGNASVVFSGDTSPSGNLMRLAQGADILVHEVIDPEWVRDLFQGRDDPAALAKQRHLLESHTPVGAVGAIAERAGVGHLILSHLAPASHRDDDWLSRVQGFSGRVSVGHDLDAFTLGHVPAPRPS